MARIPAVKPNNDSKTIPKASLSLGIPSFLTGTILYNSSRAWSCKRYGTKKKPPANVVVNPCLRISVMLRSMS